MLEGLDENIQKVEALDRQIKRIQELRSHGNLTKEGHGHLVSAQINLERAQEEAASHLKAFSDGAVEHAEAQDEPIKPETLGGFVAADDGDPKDKKENERLENERKERVQEMDNG